MTVPFALERVAFADLPAWADDDHLAAFEAFCASAARVAESEATDPGVAAVCRAALEARAATATSAAARDFFEQRFYPLRVEHQGPRGLLTGYYEPVIDGALTPDDRFNVPVYRRPADLENVVAESARATSHVPYSHLRRTVVGLEPYATRLQIEQGALAGQGLELVYLADPVETFFLHVQGSGAIQLIDGRLMRITYDGKNGHPYTSIGRTLIEEGAMSAEGLTLQALGDYLRADPARGRQVMGRNESFVFFKALDGDSPVGVLGTPLHAGRSLAVDPAHHALGLPIYVSAPAMTHVQGRAFNRLMVAHDVGSAIKGPERGDIFFGTGPDALALAGVTKHPGRFHMLMPVDGP
jgi:membrane-bound lytic murein transglycosylase A